MSMLLGHETTASTLAWAVERLLRHPEALARAREGDAAYLDAVIKETLRVRHIIPIVTRRLTRAVDLAGYRLPAGVTLLPAIAFVHENPALFSAPREFRPERFLNGEEGSTYTWIPFGGGVRRCLGMGFASLQMRLILRTILKDTSLTAPSQRDERMVRPSWIGIVPGRGVRVTRAV
jgi:cytochrome P450